MRTTILALRMGLVVLAAAAVPMGSVAEANPVATQPLAANEVLLEVSASGTANSPAELATLTGMLSTRGATEAEARRARDADVRRIIAAARRAGVTASDVTIGDAEAFDSYTMADASMEMAPVEAVEADMGATSCNVGCPPQMSEVTLSSPVELRFRDPARVGELTQAVANEGLDISFSSPTYSAGDQNAARRAARAEAIAAARADAESYAAALGMRVVRVVRVTERMGMDLMSLAMGASSPLLAMMQQQEQAQGPDIPTFVAVGVDFALAPQ